MYRKTENDTQNSVVLVEKVRVSSKQCSTGVNLSAVNLRQGALGLTNVALWWPVPSGTHRPASESRRHLSSTESSSSARLGFRDAVVRPGREDLKVHRQKGIVQPGMTKQKNGDRLVNEAARLTKGGATRRRNS
jgi:hypothetical protein